MPNYFRGTIGTLQNIIAQERQERARRHTPEYQMAIEKLMVAKRDQTFRQTMLNILRSGEELSPEKAQDVMAGLYGGEKGLFESKIKRMQLKEKRGYEEDLLAGKERLKEKALRGRPITPYEQKRLDISEKEAEARRLRAERPLRPESPLARERFEETKEKTRLGRLDKSRVSLVKRWEKLKGKPTKLKFYKAKDSDKYILPGKGIIDREDSIDKMVAVGVGTTAQKLEVAIKIIKNAQKKYPDQPISSEDLHDDVLEFLNNIAKRKKIFRNIPTAHATKARQILEKLANSGQLR